MYIEERSTGNRVEVEVIEVTPDDLPFKKDGWLFNWKTEFKQPGTTLYAVRRLDRFGNDVEAMMALRFNEGDAEAFHHYLISLIEVAPHNYGKKGDYKRSAGILIAYACQLSFSLYTNYRGTVLFTVKQGNMKLINHYIKHYGAVTIRPPLLAFEPPVTDHLMIEFLKK